MSDQSAGTGSVSSGVRFDSWKQIASYLHTSVRTVQRWEKTEGLPVRRHEHARQDTVYAYKDEVDRWREGRERKPSTSETAWEAELKSVRDALASAPARLGTASTRAGRHTVGRALEWEQLRETLRTVSEGHTRLVCLVGEPGVGKTTLLEDVAEVLSRSGEPWQAAFTTCSERLAGAEAYLPVMEMLEALMGPIPTFGGTTIKLVAPTWYVQVAPLWSSQMPRFRPCGTRKSGFATTDEARTRRLLGELTNIMPLMLVIDDMQWADAPP